MEITRFNGENIFNYLRMDIMCGGPETASDRARIKTYQAEKQTEEEALKSIFARAFPNTAHPVAHSSHEFNHHQGYMAAPACHGGE